MPSLEVPDSSRNIELAPNTSNKSLRTLSRSPHPYHRRSSSLQAVQPDVDYAQFGYNLSLDSTESDERGTEADDEKGPILKSLPAPPLRGRKGLRGSKTTAESSPAISPFPTPPTLSDWRTSYFVRERPRKTSKLDPATPEQIVESYKKYVRRKRAEVARRLTEASLLAFIGVVSCKEVHGHHYIRYGKLSQQLCNSAGVLAVLYLLFPIRVAFRKLQNGMELVTALRAGFRIPSSFDPGPLMYPVFLPLFISTSLNLSTENVVVSNLILGLSSVPRKVIPFQAHHLSAYLHWGLSLLPLAHGQSASKSSNLVNLQPHRCLGEEATLLFPLHQATLATLEYLTATSLDPAEIQLLTTGLINLYLFAVYPQAEILKALLWLGPLCLFLSCQKVLSWEVRIARIPSWKFARNKSPRTGLLSVSENLLNVILPQDRFRRARNLGSDDEDYEHLKSARRMAKTLVRLRKAQADGPQSDLEPICSENEGDAFNGNGNRFARSKTLSSIGKLPSHVLDKRRRLPTTPSTGLLSLTYNQAQGCKWVISAYVFAVVAGIILVVIRRYVSIHALSSYEPFGWAIGYLFGDIQSLRLWVVSNNLDGWISLPTHRRNNVPPAGSGWVEHFRQNRLGPANTRLLIAAWCLSVLLPGIGVVLRLKSVVEVDTRRKVFHGIMVAMLIPTIFIDPCFVALALNLILAIFLLLDLFRASQLPPVSKPLTNFLAPYVDGRDHRGPVIVSPIFLLIGCAIPLWLSLAGLLRTGQDPWFGWDTDIRDLSMISGVVCVGLGDAAASLIGRRYGKTKWFWGGGKSVEGSAAFAVAVTVGLTASHVWLMAGGWKEWNVQGLPITLFKTLIAGSGASILESVLTAGNDNVIVPVGLWLLTRGLRI